jgi:hypothetical protein
VAHLSQNVEVSGGNEGIYLRSPEPKQNQENLPDIFNLLNLRTLTLQIGSFISTIPHKSVYTFS